MQAGLSQKELCSFEGRHPFYAECEMSDNEKRVWTREENDTFCATWLTQGLVQLLRSGPRGFQIPREARHWKEAIPGQSIEVRKEVSIGHTDYVPVSTHPILKPIQTVNLRDSVAVAENSKTD